MADKHDIIVIGGGPGGYAAAIRAAQLGARVALYEKDKVGGTCLNRGCIPTKALIACTGFYDRVKKAGSYGIATGEVSIDFKAVVARKNKIVEKIVKGVEFLLEKNRVEIIRADWRPPSSFGRTGSKIILATGAAPACIPGASFDGVKFVSSRHLLDEEQVPRQMDIVGGGVIGLHFAQIYSSLGTAVTIYEALPEILPGIDEEVVAAVKRTLIRRKINIKTGVKFDPSQSCGKSLICVGRTPGIKGLERMGLETEGERVRVNAKMEASVPGVYAVGDLVSEKQFAHVAYEQGMIAAENALGADKSFSYENVPCGIYTHPEIGAAGLTEKQAREKHSDIKAGRFNYAALGIAQAMGEAEGFIKVVADRNNRLLGVHILGAEATCLIGGAVIALKNGLGIEQLSRTWQPHPSYPEGLHEASLNALKKSLHSLNA